MLSRERKGFLLLMNLIHCMLIEERQNVGRCCVEIGYTTVKPCGCGPRVTELLHSKSVHGGVTVRS